MKVRYSYAGVHMFDRTTGLNVLLDDVAVEPTKWSIAPRYMSIALTNACELTCSYCYASKVPGKLSQERLSLWARQLDREGCFGIGFGGGEPTLFPGFASLCRELHEGTKLAITMTTHGHRFESRLVDQLSGNIEFIRASMDGIGSTYERLRGRPFPVFKEKLDMIRSTARFGINYVVNAETMDDLPRAAEFAFEEGAEELLLLPQLASDGGPTLEPGLMERLSGWVQENYRRCRLATSPYGAEHIDAPMLVTSQPEYETFDFLHVDAFGVLKLSAFSRIGIRLDDAPSIIASIERLRNTIKASPKKVAP